MNRTIKPNDYKKTNRDFFENGESFSLLLVNIDMYNKVEVTKLKLLKVGDRAIIERLEDLFSLNSHLQFC
jgi:hypothetical protein